LVSEHFSNPLKEQFDNDFSHDTKLRRICQLGKDSVERKLTKERETVPWL
jgi:hypothetical protein